MFITNSQFSYWLLQELLLSAVSINQLVDYYKSCLLHDWPSYSLSIGDRPLSCSERNQIFKFKIMAEKSRSFAEV